MMKPTYEIVTTPSGNTIINAWFEDGRMLSIPTDPANSDYQRYLAWLENPEAEQSTPSVTDEA
jgi:hypothetical protein